MIYIFITFTPFTEIANFFFFYSIKPHWMFILASHLSDVSTNPKTLCTISLVIDTLVPTCDSNYMNVSQNSYHITKSVKLSIVTVV